MVSGLSGSGLVLADNGSDHLSVHADGSFTFPTSMPPGSSYSVTVAAQPTNPFQVCRVNGGSGMIRAADVTDVAVSCATSTLSLFAGQAVGFGSQDGTGASASFFAPSGVATDSAGNVYVADSFNYIIRKITPAGVVRTLAGTAGVLGSADGTSAAASFNSPYGITTDSAGNVYVADYGNDTIRKITPGGVVTTIDGQPGVEGYLFGPLPGVLAAPPYIAISGTTLYATSREAIVQVDNVP
jgi:hypothetical protein